MQSRATQITIAVVDVSRTMGETVCENRSDLDESASDLDMAAAVVSSLLRKKMVRAPPPLPCELALPSPRAVPRPAEPSR